MVNDAFLLLCIRRDHAANELAAGAGHFRGAPVDSVSTWIFRNKVRDANRRIRTAIARINSFLQEHISGMSVVQIFNRERKSQEQFAELNRIHMEAYKDAILAFALFFPGRRIFRRRGHMRRYSGTADFDRSPGWLTSAYSSRSCSTRSDFSSPFRI